MAACTGLLLLAVMLFSAGAAVSASQPDYSRPKEEAHEAVESVALTTAEPGAAAVSPQEV